MTRVIAAQLGLLAFGLAVCAGLLAGNAPATVLLRALAAMVAAAGSGLIAGGVIRLVLRDHVRSRKLKIDRRHVEQRESDADQVEPQPTVAGGAG